MGRRRRTHVHRGDVTVLLGRLGMMHHAGLLHLLHLRRRALHVWLLLLMEMLLRVLGGGRVHWGQGGVDDVSGRDGVC